jgi:hypothetical protein
MAKPKVLPVKVVPVSAVKPYPGNPRRNDEAVGAVAKSITEYGFNQPIVVDAEMVVIAGHTRLRAAQSLGMKKVPVVVVDLTPDQAKAYRIADNKTAEFADWNMGDLVAELREIGDVSDFFPMLDVNALLAEAGGLGFEPPKQAEIDAATDKAREVFTERSTEKQGNYAAVDCPECGRMFHVDRTEAMREATRPED